MPVGARAGFFRTCQVQRGFLHGSEGRECA